MILINKQEKAAISKEFPEAHIVRTMKQKSKRGRYYCVEDRAVMAYLNKFRMQNVIEEHPPRKEPQKRRGNNNGKKG